MSARIAPGRLGRIGSAVGLYPGPVPVRLPDAFQVLVSSIAWLVVSLVVGFVATRWPDTRLARPGPLTRLRHWEDGGAWWQRHLHVRRWKDRLPQAGGFMPGGRSMRHLGVRTTEGLVRFRGETVRAERVHWLIWSSLILHLIWCRPAVFAGMALFSIALNAPFIVIQRYNRGRLESLISARAARGAG